MDGAALVFWTATLDSELSAALPTPVVADSEDCVGCFD